MSKAKYIKAYIIRELNIYDEEYQKINHYFKQANSLYLNSRHKLLEKTNMSHYLNAYDQLYNINENFATEIKRVALMDHEMKNQHRSINQSTLSINIYNSDVTFTQNDITIDMLEISIPFDFTSQVKSVHQFKLIRDKNKYYIQIECAINIKKLNVISMCNQSFIDQNFNETSQLENCVIVGLKHYYQNERLSRQLFIENRHNNQQAFDSYDNLMSCQELYQERLSIEKNIAIQIMQFLS